MTQLSLNILNISPFCSILISDNREFREILSHNDSI